MLNYLLLFLISIVSLIEYYDSHGKSRTGRILITLIGLSLIIGCVLQWKTNKKESEAEADANNLKRQREKEFAVNVHKLDSISLRLSDTRHLIYTQDSKNDQNFKTNLLALKNMLAELSQIKRQFTLEFKIQDKTLKRSLDSISTIALKLKDVSNKLESVNLPFVPIRISFSAHFKYTENPLKNAERDLGNQSQFSEWLTFYNKQDLIDYGLFLYPKFTNDTLAKRIFLRSCFLDISSIKDSTTCFSYPRLESHEYDTRDRVFIDASNLYSDYSIKILNNRLKNELIFEMSYTILDLDPKLNICNLNSFRDILESTIQVNFKFPFQTIDHLFNDTLFVQNYNRTVNPFVFNFDEIYLDSMLTIDFGTDFQKTQTFKLIRPEMKYDNKTNTCRAKYRVM